MCPLPIDPAARKRLQDAQRAEADALKVVELALRARERAQSKLDAANTHVDEASVGLIRVSGLSRTALLLDQQESALRRAWRDARQPAQGEDSDTPPIS